MHKLLTPEFTFEKARQELNVAAEEKKLAQRNTSVHGGDYWQNGDGYIGPQPVPGKNYDQTLANIKKLFRAEGIFKEIVDRQVNALFARPAVVSFERKTKQTQKPAKTDPTANPPEPPTPQPQPEPDPQPGQLRFPQRKPGQPELNPDGTVKDEPVDPLVEEVAGVFNEWLASKDVRLAMQRVVERRLLTQHGAWRYLIPPRLAVVEKNKDKSLLEVLKGLGIDEPTLEMARVVRDAEDNSILSVTQFGVTAVDKQGKLEVCFTDDEGRTFIGLLLPGDSGTKGNRTNGLPDDGLQAGLNIASLPGSTDGGPDPVELEADGSEKPVPQPPWNDLSEPIDLKGNLMTYEMVGPTLTTETVWQNTKALSLVLTMANMVSIEAGHSEMALTNVEIETVEVLDITAPGGKREVPRREIERGQSAVNNFIGVEEPQADGSVKIKDPQVLWKDPTPVTTQVEGYELAKRTILDEVHQLHAMIADEATATGESRLQALADFADATTKLQTEVNHFGTWVIQTALYLLANLLARPELLELRGRFEAQISAGQLSADQAGQVLTQVEKKVRSKRSARYLFGIFDSEAEDMQIRREAQDEMTMPNSPSNPANPMSPINPEALKRQEQLAKKPPTNQPPFQQQ